MASISNATEQNPASVQTPIQLTAYGGTPPYTWSATNLPAGLSIQGDQIVGQVSAVTPEARVTLTVTDAATDTATTHIYMRVDAIANPVPIYSFPVRARGGIKFGGMLAIEIPPTAAASGTIKFGGSIGLLSPFLRASGGLRFGGSILTQAALAAAKGGIKFGGGISITPIVAKAKGGIEFGGKGQAIITIQPSAYFHLDETSGDRANSVPTGPSLLEDGSVTSTAGVRGEAAVFNGNTNNHLRSTDPFFNFSSTFHITGFVSASSAATQQVIISKWNFEGQRSYFLSLENNQLNFFVSNDGASFDVSASVSFITGSFQFFDCYYDSTANEIGVALNAGSHATATQTAIKSDSTAEFKVGRFDTPTGISFPLSGSVDLLGFFSFKLSDTERTILSAGKLYEEIQV